jgi:DHA2 family methylenomycin A resistance protein-like MFS transporter
VTGAVFIAVEARTAEPMLELSLFRSRHVSAMLLLGLIFQIMFYGQLFLFSLFFQQAYGWNALQAGLAVVPQTAVGSVLLLFMTKRLIHWFKPQVNLEIGMALGFVGVLVILVGVHTSYPIMALGEMLVGATAAFVVAPMTSMVLNGVAKEQASMASAALNAARQMGGALGVALLGTALGSQTLMAGVQVALGILLGTCVIGFGLVMSSIDR